MRIFEGRAKSIRIITVNYGDSALNAVLNKARIWCLTQILRGEALKDWLARNSKFDTVKTFTCNCQERMSKGENPYVAIGDFNGDGRSDFAIFLKLQRSGPTRAYLAIFNGLPQSGKYRLAFLEEYLDFERVQDEFFVQDDGKSLIVGQPESDNLFMVTPEGKTYELE